jgi:hypothetical protein
MGIGIPEEGIRYSRRERKGSGFSRIILNMGGREGLGYSRRGRGCCIQEVRKRCGIPYSRKRNDFWSFLEEGRIAEVS